MFPPLPTKRAHLYCKLLFSRLNDGSLRLKQVSRPSEERDGHGVMIGVLVCADANGEKVILAAPSGNSLVFATGDAANDDGMTSGDVDENAIYTANYIGRTTGNEIHTTNYVAQIMGDCDEPHDAVAGSTTGDAANDEDATNNCGCVLRSFKIGKNDTVIFVPPIVAASEIDKALLPNDKKIHELTALLKTAPESDKRRIAEERAKLTNESLAAVHALYKFHCIDGSVKTLADICGGKLPPTGTGDCAAPKLLDYAFSHGFFPVSMDEMYYGKATPHKQNGVSYAPCNERCALILPAMLGLEIVYRDDDILVVNKPVGLLSVPGRGPEKQDCVTNRMKRLFPKTIDYPAAHRLDMETSGLMVLAFTRGAERNLQRQFEESSLSQDGSDGIHKQYVALLDGAIEDAQGELAPAPGVSAGELRLRFSLDWENRPKRVYDEAHGKLNVTKWEKVGYAWCDGADGKRKKATRVLFTPLTGRTHQIRVSCADKHGFGMAIAGDSLYGTKSADGRLMLHAQYLSFTHPATGERMEFNCPAPF